MGLEEADLGPEPSQLGAQGLAVLPQGSRDLDREPRTRGQGSPGHVEGAAAEEGLAAGVVVEADVAPEQERAGL